MFCSTLKCKSTDQSKRNKEITGRKKYITYITFFFLQISLHRWNNEIIPHFVVKIQKWNIWLGYKTIMSGFSLLSLSPKLILLCLLWDHAGGLCKYFSFASWHDIKPCHLEGLVGHWRKKRFVFPPWFQRSLLSASCSIQFYLMFYSCRVEFL